MPLRFLALPFALLGSWLAPTFVRADETPPLPRGTPSVPMVASRPSSWPGGRTNHDFQTLEMATVVARVGPEVILAGDVSGAVRELLAVNVEKIPPDQAEEVARMFLKQAVSGAVDRKLLYVTAKRKIPDEGFTKVKEQVHEEFERTELRKMLREVGATNRADLEALLRARGTSLEREKQTYLEKALGFHQISEATKQEAEITHDDMLAYYREHATDYDRPARAHWQQLMIRRSKSVVAETAHNKLAWLGNQILAGGDWAALAKAHSQGPDAASGGDRGWTSQKALKSEALDGALFQLPVGTLSPILDDDQGWHIIRVVEREPAGRVPFEQAQDEIKKKISEQRRQDRFKNYVAEVRAGNEVWTIFDDVAAADRLVTYLAAPIVEYLRTAPRRPRESGLEARQTPRRDGRTR